MRQPVVRLSALVVVSVLLAACSPHGFGSTAPSPPQPTLVLKPVDPWVSTVSVPKEASPTVVHGLAPVTRSSGSIWTTATSPASRSFTLIWDEGVSDRCGRVQTLYVTETPTTVIVELGDAPMDPPFGQTCVAMAVIVKHTIVLSAPLGRRTILTPGVA